MGAIATGTQYISSLKTTAAGFLSAPSWDIMLLIALVGASFFYGIMMGKRRIVASILNTYIAFAIYTALAESTLLSRFSFADPLIIQIGVFLALFVVLYFLLGSRSSRGPVRATAWWQVFLLSFVQVGFLFHIIIGFLSQETIATLAPITKKLFVNPTLNIWWFLIPIALVIFFRRWGRED